MYELYEAIKNDEYLQKLFKRADRIQKITTVIGSIAFVFIIATTSSKILNFLWPYSSSFALIAFFLYLFLNIKISKKIDKYKIEHGLVPKYNQANDRLLLLIKEAKDNELIKLSELFNDLLLKKKVMVSVDKTNIDLIIRNHEHEIQISFDNECISIIIDEEGSEKDVKFLELDYTDENLNALYLMIYQNCKNALIN